VGERERRRKQGQRKGGEMTQTLYAHINKEAKKQKTNTGHI
jgi:hypothetical protein